MSKPSWDDAPEWAKWMAMDENANWYWHEVRPSWDDFEWISSGKTVLAGEEKHPTETLEKRP